MSRLGLCLAALLCLGCHAPMPSAANWLAPNGMARVAPPSTGNFGTADPYYQQQSTATAPAGTDRRSRTQQPDRASWDRNNRDSFARDNRAGEEDIRRASFQDDVARGGQEPRMQVIESPSRTRSDSRFDPPFNGMPVSGRPAVTRTTLNSRPEITDLPQVSNVPVLRRDQPREPQRTVSSGGSSSYDDWRSRR